MIKLEVYDDSYCLLAKLRWYTVRPSRGCLFRDFHVYGLIVLLSAQVYVEAHWRCGCEEAQDSRIRMMSVPNAGANLRM
jgi:hypothetical protein